MNDRALLTIDPSYAMAGVQVGSPKAAAIPYRLHPIKIYAFDHIQNCPNRQRSIDTKDFLESDIAGPSEVTFEKLVHEDCQV